MPAITSYFGFLLVALTVTPTLVRPYHFYQQHSIQMWLNYTDYLFDVEREGEEDKEGKKLEF